MLSHNCAGAWQVSPLRPADLGTPTTRSGTADTNNAVLVSPVLILQACCHQDRPHGHGKHGKHECPYDAATGRWNDPCPMNSSPIQGVCSAMPSLLYAAAQGSVV